MIAVFALILLFGLWLWHQSQIVICCCGANVNLNATQISTYAQNAGFSGGDLIIAVAIALAESSGNTRAYNPEVSACTPDGLGSFGLWQIYRKVHPEFANMDLFDPQQNAEAAFSVYSQAGGSFLPWSTFKGGQYQSHLPVAQAACSNQTSCTCGG